MTQKSFVSFLFSSFEWKTKFDIRLLFFFASTLNFVLHSNTLFLTHCGAVRKERKKTTKIDRLTGWNCFYSIFCFSSRRSTLIKRDCHPRAARVELYVFEPLKTRGKTIRFVKFSLEKRKTFRCFEKNFLRTEILAFSNISPNELFHFDPRPFVTTLNSICSASERRTAQFECSFSFFTQNNFFNEENFFSFSFGRASFQLSFVFEPNVAVDKLLFVEGLGRILVLTDDGDFHLLEINFFSNLRIDRLCTSAEENRSFHRQIRSICLLREQTSLLLGLNDGNIHRFDLECFQLEQKPLISVETIEKMFLLLMLKIFQFERTIFFRVFRIAQHSRRRSVRPTTVQSIVQHPENNGKIIIAYKNKIIVHWDLPSNSHDRVYIYNQVS